MQTNDRATTGNARPAIKRKRTLLLIFGGVLVLLLGFLAFDMLPPLSAYLSGNRQRNAGAYSDAIASYQTALAYQDAKLIPGWYFDGSVAGIVECEIALSQAHAEGGSFDQAEATLRASSMEEAQRDALLCELYAARADAGMQDAQYEEAETYYRKAAALAGDADRALYENRAVIAGAQALSAAGGYTQALALLAPLADFENTTALIPQIEARKVDALTAQVANCRNTIAAGAWFTAGTGGAALLAGDAQYDVSAIPASDRVYAGLFNAIFTKDGAVTGIAGSAMGGRTALASETGIAKAASGLNHILVLKDDGSVQGFGSEAFLKLDVAGWADIADIAAGGYHSLGLRRDGTVLAAGNNAFAQCDTSAWSGVTQVAAGLNHSVALRTDGTVAACGDNTYGQCDVTGWTDILAVYAGANHTVGLKNDFTLVACGDNRSGQCDVSGWTDIVSVACGVWHTAGLRADGAIAFAGSDANGQAGVADWRIDTGTAAYPDAAPLTVADSAAELVYSDFESSDGPWLYLAPTGAVNICYDDTTERIPIRADLFAAGGSSPFGAFAELDPAAATTGKPARIARQNKAIFAQTGDFLSWKGNKKGVMIRGGKVFFDDADAPTMAFLPNGEMRLYEAGAVTADELIALGVQNSWSFGPILVIDGAENPGLAKVKTNKYRCARCAIGMVEPNHYISIVTSVGTDRYMNLTDLASTFLHYGCTAAYNLDGGNSASMVFMGESINYHRWDGRAKLGMRPLCDMFAFLTSDSLPDPDGEYRRIDTDYDWRKKLYG